MMGLGDWQAMMKTMCLSYKKSTNNMTCWIKRGNNETNLIYLLVPLNGDPRPVEIPRDEDAGYAALREHVGGTIGSQRIFGRLVATVNDNGLMGCLPYNRCGFVGNFLIGKTNIAGADLSMTPKDISQAEAWLARNDQRPPICHICQEPGNATLFCPCRDVLIYCQHCYHQLNDVLQGSNNARKA